jgi:sortase (surface protein transpeptidase)
MNNWNQSFKIFLSISLTLISIIVGLLSTIPITEVDALVSQVTEIQSIYSSEFVESVTLAHQQESEISPEFIPTLIELPNQYYVQPEPVVVAESVPQYQSNTQNSGPQLIQTLSQTPVVSSISIPRIGLNNVLYSSGSMTNINDIDSKLLQGPVIDTHYAVDACQPNSHTYLMGHSEPSFGWQSGYPGAYIFNQLHTLVPGDTITMTNIAGQSCTYEVTGWDRVETDSNDSVSWEVFNSVMFPDISQHGVLSIQTCELGSATVRLILRARLVS